MGSKFLINYLRHKWCDLQSLFMAPRLGCACAQPSCGLYQHAKFGEIELRVPAAGAKIGVFCMSRLVCLRVGDIHVVQTSIVWRFMGRFWCSFQRFFQNGLFSQMHYIVLIFVARWRHNFRESCCQKLRKVQKSAEKFVRTTSYRQLRDLKKFPTQ